MIEPLKVSDRGEWFSIFGKRFSTREAAINHRDGVIAKRTKLLGRTPTTRELLTRPDKPDTRTASEKARDENFRVVTGDEPVADNGNPFRKQLAPPKSTREGIRRQQEAAWDARYEAQEQQAERDADPDRQRSIAWAETNLETAVWSKDASYSDVVRAEQLLAQAKRGDLSHFHAMAEQVVANQVDKYAERRAAAEQRLAAEQKLLDEMQPPSPPSADAPPAEPRRYVFRGGKTIPADEL